MTKLGLKKYIFRQPNPYYAFFASMLSLLFGLWLLMPWAHFVIIPGNHFVWGMASFAVGILPILLIKFQVKTFFRGYFYQALFWFFLMSAALYGDWHSPGWIIFLWLAIFNGFGYINRKFWST